MHCAGMVQHIDPTRGRRGQTNWEAWLSAAIIATIGGLVVADRVAAWLIGTSPSTALFWQIRFEYLRPVGVYYEIAVAELGAVSALSFCTVAVAAGFAVAIAARSRARLAKAAAFHAMLFAALPLSVFSWDIGRTMRAEIGAPSVAYSLIGMALSLVSLGLCLRVHAHYLGLKPARIRHLLRERACSIDVVTAFGRYLAAMGEMLAAPKPVPALLAIVARPRHRRGSGVARP